MKKIKCKAVFFDLWDTLIMSKGVTKKTQRLMGLAKYGFKYFIKRFEKATMLKKFSSMEAFAIAAFAQFGLKPEKKKIKTVVLLWKKHLLRAKPFPETLVVLRALKKMGFKLALVSNSHYFGVRNILKQNGILPLLDSIQLSFETHLLKPDARIFVRALKELGIKPQDAIMVGDSRTDAWGAQNAKMRAILVQRKHGRKKYYKAVAVISSLSELLELLEVEKNGNN